MKKYLLPALCLIFIAALITFPQTAFTAALKGLNLWFDIVLPSLFPFFVASEILGETGFVKAAGRIFEPLMRPIFRVPGCGSFAMAMGVSSGYPSGAKITCDLWDKGYLTKTEAERLITFTNNSGPLFISGAVATGMLNSPGLGIMLLSSHILGSITVGMIFRFYRGIGPDKALLKPMKALTKQKKDKFNFGRVFGNAVRNSMMTLFSIGGFIILFSVIINLLLETGAIGMLSDILSILLKPLGFAKEILEALLCGIMEITTGSNLASKAVGIPADLKLAAVSFIIGWAGLSVHSQVLSIINKTGISILPYLAGKFLHGVLSAFYTFLFVNAAGLAIGSTAPAAAMSENAAAGYSGGILTGNHIIGDALFLEIFLNSVVCMAIILAAYFTLSAISRLLPGSSPIMKKVQKTVK